MTRTVRSLGWILAGVLLAAGAFLVATRSEFGRNRIRQYALDALRARINGRVEISRIEGNVFGRFTLAGVSITDAAGQPFVEAERVTATLDARGLLSRHITLSNVILVRPVVHLTRTPEAGWNLARIFRSAGSSVADSTPGFGDWVAFNNVRVRDGELVIERPWSPNADLQGALREAAIREALVGRTRTRVDRTSYGLRQTMDFRRIGAVLSRLVVADPARYDILLEIDSLVAVAAPFHPPVLDVRHFSGVVRVGTDTVTAPEFTMHLPNTVTAGSMRYVLGTGDILGALRLDTLALADLRVIHPSLPDSGGGRMDLELAMRDTGSSEYLVSRAALQVGSAQLQGALGLVVSDSVTRFRNTDLQFHRLPTSLIERVVPGAHFPFAGEFTGHARVDGPLEAMQVDIDAGVNAERHPPFRVVARGGLGTRGELTANRLYVRTDRLYVRTDRLPLSLVRALGARLPLGGTVSAVATLSGSTRSRIGGPYEVTHRENRAVSHMEGRGTLAVRDGMRMDVGVRFDPVSLEVLQRFVKGTEVRGTATGTGRVQGTPRNLAASLKLALPDSGRVEVDGTWELARDRVPVFHAAVALDDVDVRAVMPALPTTTIHGTSQLTGRGSTLGSLDARLVTDLSVLMVDSAEFRDVVVRARANDGLLTVDTLRGTSAFGAASASGTLGVVEGREGAMQYRAEVSDLNGLARWIASGDTGAVAARPLVGTRLARLRQRLDSIQRAAQARTDPAAALVAELREADEKKGPAAVVPAIPRDSIAGSLLATGEARGSIAHLDVSGTVTTPGLVWGGSLVGAGRVDVRVSGAGKPAAAFEVGGAVDSLRVAGFALDSTRFTGTYRGGEGEVEVAIFPGDTAEYRLGATYALRTNEGEVRLRDIRLRFDSTAWTSVRPSTVSWRGQGIAIDSLELRNHEGRGGGRIFVNGEVPDADPGRLDVAVDSLRLAPWLTLLQSDVRADGVASFTGTVEGTRRAPRIDASLRVSDPTYQGTEFPELAARIEYDARSLVLDGRIRSRQGGELAHVTGTLPIDLSLGDPVRTRRVDAPLALTIEGDSIPLSPLTTFTGAVAGLDGRAYGRIEVGGTWERPRLGGGVGLEVRRVALAATGVQVRNVTGQLRMTGDSLTIDSLVGESEGRVQVTGRIALPELTEPRLDLALQAFEARILRNDRGSLVASGDVRVSGPVDTLSVTGRVTVNHGVVNIPDPERLDLINTHDPAIFAVVDTATARRLDVAPPSATRRNLRLDVDLDVQRGVFARSPHANVEVFGNLGVRSNPSTGGKLVVTGALYTDRGDYQFMGKRFVVTRGSVRFTGEPDPNPALQVIAIYEVRQARRAPLDIRVVIGGTLDRPQLALESESQPTLSQSDLIAFLAFGQSSTALVQFAGTGLEAEGHGGSSLAGNVGAAATRQLASVALGALVDEARVDLTRATRADVVNITPAQIPEDLSSGELQALLFGTELEMGKYLDRDTFLLGRVRPSLVVPGVSLERRFSEQFRVRANFETRLQSQRPSLGTGLTPRTLNVFGAVLRWSISW